MSAARGPSIDLGEPAPLGATWDGKGVNFALFSAHAERVELCIFDERGRRELHRLQLPGYTDEAWHGYVPDARPGLRYGFRVYGPYRPRDGHRFNHHKLLLDPYARLLAGPLRWSDACFGYRIGSAHPESSFDRRDDASMVPKCVVVESAFTWSDDRRLNLPWRDAIIYELHVRGFTMQFPGIPPHLRGTFSALASPAVLDYLVRLGISAVELMPVQAFIDERRLVERGLRNYWGYNPIGFFAPHALYLSEPNVAEFRTMVRRFHQAGLEVILDVVYNHTAEGDHLGPTLSFRGIDNATYYRLAVDRHYYDDPTGCGNALNLEQPRVVQMVMDSLRYWTEEMHVDGFRFDLAATLGRTAHGFNQNAAFFAAIAQDPVLSRVKLIAEPWDVGPGGYQLGQFPPGWSEWNGRFRDGGRHFWQGNNGMLSEMATRLTGSADVFEHKGRRIRSSLNFVTAHDGFTLADLVSYNEKHNEPNGDENRDGTNANYSWNCGTEGPTDDPAILALRRRQKRNLLATLLLAQGVPMLLAGDERSRTQNGNNNAYCHDSPLTWIDWQSPDDPELGEFVRKLIALRRSSRAFRRDFYASGNPLNVQANGVEERATSPAQRGDGLSDVPAIRWLTLEGRGMEEGDWADAGRRAFGWLIEADSSEPKLPLTSREARFLIYFNAHDFDLVAHPPPSEGGWKIVVDTAEPAGHATTRTASDTWNVASHSLMVLHSV